MEWRQNEVPQNALMDFGIIASSPLLVGNGMTIKVIDVTFESMPTCLVCTSCNLMP
jgi:hypothetical protein